MADSTSLTTRSGLAFTVDVAGPAEGPLVLLLHGFPESRHSWRAALPALAAAGYRAVAPDQRGYSPGARPDPATLANYAFDKLVADAIESQGLPAMTASASIWSATTGAARSPGESRASIPIASPRSPCCRGRIPSLSVARS